MSKQTALVKWFDNAKGFGFINPINDPETDCIVHHRSIIGEGYKTLKEGQEVECIQTESNKGWQAVEVVPVS